MDKIDPKIKVTELDDKTEQKQRAMDILEGTPQPAMTAPVNTVISTGSAGPYVEAANSTAIENMRTRINELETALVRLGLIKSR